MQEINFNQITMNDINYIQNGSLGTGGFGTVSLITIKNNPKLYALKKVDLTPLLPMEAEHIKQEIKHHLNLTHPNIIKFYHAIYQGTDLFMIQDYAKNGDLYNRMQTIKKFDEYNAVKIIWQILQALIYIHDKFIIHRDLKPENILLDENYNCLITDFGWSGEFDANKRRQTYCGTYEYMAPEIVTGAQQSDKTDIWSLGIIAYEQMHGKTPFLANTAEEINNNTLKGSIPINKNLSNEIKNFIKQTLRHHSENRLSGRQCVEHPLFIKHRLATDSLKVKIDFTVPSPSKKNFQKKKDIEVESKNLTDKSLADQKSSSQKNIKIIDHVKNDAGINKIVNENVKNTNLTNQTNNDYEHHSINTDIHGKNITIIRGSTHNNVEPDKFKVMYANTKNNNVKKYVGGGTFIKQNQHQVVGEVEYNQSNNVNASNLNQTQTVYKNSGEYDYTPGKQNNTLRADIYSKTNIYNDNTYGKTSGYNDTTYVKPNGTTETNVLQSKINDDNVFAKRSGYNVNSFIKSNGINETTYVKPSNYNEVTYKKANNYSDTLYIKPSNYNDIKTTDTSYTIQSSFPKSPKKYEKSSINPLTSPINHLVQGKSNYHDKSQKVLTSAYTNTGYIQSQPNSTILTQSNILGGTTFSGPNHHKSRSNQPESRYQPQSTLQNTSYYAPNSQMPATYYKR